MDWRNPNRPEHLEDPRPEPKYFKSNTGDAAADGYTVVKRRPRVRHAMEAVDPERADRIEDAFGIGGADADNDADD